MKFLTTLFVAGALSISTVACAKEEPKKSPAVAAPVAAAPMAATVDIKKDEAPTTKRVCVDVQGRDGKPVIDPKTKKPKQDCKNVTVRKKFEGTRIEDAKKK